MKVHRPGETRMGEKSDFTFRGRTPPGEAHPRSLARRNLGLDEDLHPPPDRSRVERRQEASGARLHARLHPRLFAAPGPGSRRDGQRLPRRRGARPQTGTEAPPSGAGSKSLFRGRRGTAGAIVVCVTGVLLLLGLIVRPERRSTPVAAEHGASGGVGQLQERRGVARPRSGDSGAGSRRRCPRRRRRPASRWSSSSSRIRGRKSRPTARASSPGLIRRGSKHQFDAREGFRLTLGNAGGVRVTVDGRAMEPLGTAGQVVRDMPVPGPRLTQS